MEKNPGILRVLLVVVVIGALSIDDVSAQLNRRVGLTLGASYLSGNSGFIFDSELEIPHRDFGLAAGLTFFVPLDRDLHLTLGGLLNYEKSHFHTEVRGVDDILTAYYHYAFLQVPILLNHASRHRNGQPFVLKEFFGFAFNLGNLITDPMEGDLDGQGRFGYRTEVRQNWEINPEFVIGLGLISRRRPVGIFHYSLSLHLDVAKNQIFKAILFDKEASQSIAVDRQIRGIKAMAQLTFYPYLAFKKKACYRN